jgi:FKBP-type peptidyl-prolyl cis-trans isomerase
MEKSMNVVRTILTVGMLLLGNAVAQKSTTTPTKTPPPPAKAQPTPAAKELPDAPKANSQANAALPTPKDKASYAIGMQFGATIVRSGADSADVDTNVLLKGINDTIAGKPIMTEDEAHAVLTQLQNSLNAKREEKMKLAAETNKKEGDEFLAANKAKEGVVTTPSGLQYKILKEGTGPKPTANDKVVCNYRGTLINGTEFDSSYKRGQPTTFPVTGVIKGWTEALQLMPVGSKWQLFIPSDLAYGSQPPPRANFGPNATLLFELELLSIEASAPPPDKK